MLTERRFAYRVSPEADEVIRATLRGDVCQSGGEVTDLSLKGATVCIALEENPTFYLGEKVTLTLNSRRMQSVRVLATVQSRAELNGSRRFGLVFPDPSILRARLSVGLLRMFNEQVATSPTVLQLLPSTPSTPGRALCRETPAVAPSCCPGTRRSLRSRTTLT